MVWLRAFLYGLLEGITEWLPISSTGHLILLGDVLALPLSHEAFAMFEVVIQLGAILAVAVLYRKTLFPIFAPREEKKRAWRLWGMVALAVLPSALIGFFFDDLLDRYLYHAPVVAVALIVYGVLFLCIRRPRRVSLEQTDGISPRMALGVGLFQSLALIPGTSRSGATIMGGLCLGLSRTAAAEFSFFLGIPTMAGAGLLKTVKFFAGGNTLTATEWGLFAVATLTAFAVSLVVIRFLLDFVKRHSFAAFGVYRIVLGTAVLAQLFFCR